MAVSADLDANFDKIRQGIKLAADKGARLIALPECALSGYPPLHYDKPADIDTIRISELNGEVCDLAKEHGINIVLGTILTGSDGLLNSALVISDKGEIVGRYDKLHLMPLDKNYFAPGAGAWVFPIDDLMVCVQICYDARFPEAFRYLRELGAQVIVIILNACGSDTWKVPVFEGTFRTRASENSCFIVAVNAAGPLQMAVSRIIDPIGLDLTSANQDREEMLFAELDLSRLDEGYFADRRIDLFEVRPKFADIRLV